MSATGFEERSEHLRMEGVRDEVPMGTVRGVVKSDNDLIICFCAA